MNLVLVSSAPKSLGGEGGGWSQFGPKIKKGQPPSPPPGPSLGSVTKSPVA